MPSWTIREAAPGDLGQIRKLYAESYGWSRPVACDAWRTGGNTYGHNPGVVAVDNGQVVGCYSVWPTPLRIGGQAVLGGQAVDLVVRSSFRGQGMFLALLRAGSEMAAERGFHPLYGFPISEILSAYIRRLKWAHIDDIPHWFRPLRISSHPKFPMGWKAPLGTLADALLLSWPAGRRGGYKVAASAACPGELSRLAGGEENGARCRVDRTAEWLTWRYSPDAAQGYEWIGATEGGRIRAVAVWGMRDESWSGQRDGRARLVELEGESHEARVAALSLVIARARAGGAWLLETVTNCPQTIRALRRAGFIAHRSAPLILYVRGEKLEFRSGNMADWRIVGGDLDTF